jgi:hypothetical protein
MEGPFMNPKIVKVKRRAKHQHTAGVVPPKRDMLERTKALLLAALRVWELKQRILK